MRVTVCAKRARTAGCPQRFARCVAMWCDAQRRVVERCDAPKRVALPTVMSISPTRLINSAKTWRGREAASRQRCCRIVFIFVSDSMRPPSLPSLPTIMPRPASRPCASASPPDAQGSPKVLWTSSGTSLAIRRCRPFSKEGPPWIGMLLNMRPTVTLALPSWQALPSSSGCNYGCLHHDA